MQVTVTATELKLGDVPTNPEFDGTEIVGVVPDHDGHWVYFGEGENAWASTFLPVDGVLEVTR